MARSRKCRACRRISPGPSAAWRAPPRGGRPRAGVAGPPLASARYEMVVDRRPGIAPGSRVAIGRLRFSVVGLSDGMVGSGGDPVVFVSLQDAQGSQFLQGNEAIRNDRARLEADLGASGTGGGGR